MPRNVSQEDLLDDFPRDQNEPHQFVVPWIILLGFSLKICTEFTFLWYLGSSPYLHVLSEMVESSLAMTLTGTDIGGIDTAYMVPRTHMG